jgi:Na+/glutamate symporter
VTQITGNFDAAVGAFFLDIANAAIIQSFLSMSLFQ